MVPGVIVVAYDAVDRTDVLGIADGLRETVDLEPVKVFRDPGNYIVVSCRVDHLTCLGEHAAPGGFHVVVDAVTRKIDRY